MAAREPVAIRSYRAVLDDVERRIYRVDRWRLPAPGGVQVRAIAYTVGAAVVVAAGSGLPLVGGLLGLLPASVRYLALPIAAGWGLASWRIDGRAPHHALAALGRFVARARTLSGIAPSPAVGVQLAPVAAVQISPVGDESVYRSGRVRGPARVVLRYPARLEFERTGWRTPPGERIARARRVRVSGVDSAGRPLVVGHELRVPDGAEVVFE